LETETIIIKYLELLAAAKAVDEEVVGTTKTDDAALDNLSAVLAGHSEFQSKLKL
jgi:hypothetical protein